MFKVTLSPDAAFVSPSAFVVDAAVVAAPPAVVSGLSALEPQAVKDAAARSAASDVANSLFFNCKTSLYFFVISTFYGKYAQW